MSIKHDPLSFKVYQELAALTSVKHANKITKLVNGLMGLIGETGEVSEIWKKYLFHKGGKVEVHQYLAMTEFTKEELGDLLWYIVQIADAIDADLEEIAQNNLDKLARRHIDGFKGSSIVIGAPDEQ